MFKPSLDNAGFTMIELLVVMSIAGIMAAVAFIAIAGPLQEASLENSRATVMTAMEAARNRAMQGVGDGSGGQTVSIAADGKSITTNGASLPISPNVTMNQTGNSITFSRISGQTSGMTITLTDNSGDTKTVTITSEGYVY